MQTTDSQVGNVSYVVPTLHSMFGIPVPGNNSFHHPAFASAAETDEAHVGKSLALIGWHMITDDALFETAHGNGRSRLSMRVNPCDLLLCCFGGWDDMTIQIYFVLVTMQTRGKF